MFRNLALRARVAPQWLERRGRRGIARAVLNHRGRPPPKEHIVSAVDPNATAPQYSADRPYWWDGASRTRATVPRRLLLLTFATAVLLLSACTDGGSASDNNSASSPATSTATAFATPIAVAAAEPSPVASAVAVAPVVAAPVVAAPVVAAPADPYAAATAAGASAVCHDRTWSYSKHRSGTCSSHGGVHWWTGNLGPAGPGAH